MANTLAPSSIIFKVGGQKVTLSLNSGARDSYKTYRYSVSVVCRNEAAQQRNWVVQFKLKSAKNNKCLLKTFEQIFFKSLSGRVPYKSIREFQMMHISA